MVLVFLKVNDVQRASLKYDVTLLLVASQPKNKQERVRKHTQKKR